MCQRTDKGFTLLELMLSLVIMGSMLALGLGFFHSWPSQAGQISDALAALLSRTRAEAMLSRQDAILELKGRRICQKSGGGKLIQMKTLPSDLKISIAGKELPMDGAEQFRFSAKGVTDEKLIYLNDGKQSFSLYIPAIGAPFARPGICQIQEMRKEKP